MLSKYRHTDAGQGREVSGARAERGGGCEAFTRGFRLNAGHAQHSNGHQRVARKTGNPMVCGSGARAPCGMRHTRAATGVATALLCVPRANQRQVRSAAVTVGTFRRHKHLHTVIYCRKVPKPVENSVAWVLGRRQKNWPPSGGGHRTARHAEHIAHIGTKKRFTGPSAA